MSKDKNPLAMTELLEVELEQAKDEIDRLRAERDAAGNRVIQLEREIKNLVAMQKEVTQEMIDFRKQEHASLTSQNARYRAALESISRTALTSRQPLVEIRRIVEAALSPTQEGEKLADASVYGDGERCPDGHTLEDHEKMGWTCDKHVSPPKPARGPKPDRLIGGKRYPRK